MYPRSHLHITWHRLELCHPCPCETVSHKLKHQTHYMGSPVEPELLKLVFFLQKTTIDTTLLKNSGLPCHYSSKCLFLIGSIQDLPNENQYSLGEKLFVTLDPVHTHTHTHTYTNTSINFNWLLCLPTSS